MPKTKTPKAPAPLYTEKTVKVTLEVKSYGNDEQAQQTSLRIIRTIAVAMNDDVSGKAFDGDSYTFDRKGKCISHPDLEDRM